MAAVELLLARGAAQTDSMEGATPLIIALQYHHPEIALRLLRTTPPPSVDHRVPRDGSSAMFVAAGMGAWRCIHEWERARKGLGKEWERTRKGMGKAANVTEVAVAVVGRRPRARGRASATM